MKRFSSFGKIAAGLLLIAAAGCSQNAKVQTSSAAAKTKVPAPVPAGYRVVKDLPYYPKDFRPLSGDAEYAAERCKSTASGGGAGKSKYGRVQTSTDGYGQGAADFCARNLIFGRSRYTL